MNALAARRRHPAALTVVLILGLLLTGAIYALAAPQRAGASSVSADQVAEGKQLFQANCASCHGLNADGRTANNGKETTTFGPSLAGVGAAAVDFQMGTGRMPMAQPGVQAPRNDKQILFSDAQIEAIGAYIASLAPGPAIPSPEYATAEGGDAGRGGEIFRVNCAMCHSSAQAGGALTRGKYAPALGGVEPSHIYEAMLTGPQSMPVFNDMNLTPEDKRDVIAYIKTMEAEGNPGGMALGNFGPVPEGMFAWVFGLGIMIAAAVWLGQKGA